MTIKVCKTRHFASFLSFFSEYTLRLSQENTRITDGAIADESSVKNLSVFSFTRRRSSQPDEVGFHPLETDFFCQRQISPAKADLISLSAGYCYAGFSLRWARSFIGLGVSAPHYARYRLWRYAAQRPLRCR